MRILGWGLLGTLAACAEPTPPRVTADGGTMLACTTETDCTASVPYCEPTTSTCVACRFTSRCGDAVDLSADGCELAFTSTRGGGSRDIWLSTVLP